MKSEDTEMLVLNRWVGLLKFLAIAGGVVSLVPQSLHSQGFSGTLGMGSAKTVGIKQLLPATVNLSNKRIAIKATSAIKTTSDELVTILQTKLVTFIQKDPRFRVDNQHPQTLLKFTVTNSYIEERHYSVPGPNNSTVPCNGFTGKLEVSYQAFDTSNDAPLDSENLVAQIAEEDEKSQQQSLAGGLKDTLTFHRNKGACGTDAKTTMHEAQDQVVDGIVRQMAQRAAPTDTIIEVKLPGKKLEVLSRLAMAQRWGTLEEEAQKFEPLPKPEDDAYRLYLIALAKEAQAYDLAREAQERENGKRPDISQAQADADFQKAMRLIDEARKLYRDAIQAKPGEKVFQEPDNRMEKAVAVYATINRHKDEYKKAVLASQQQPKTPPRSSTVSSQSTDDASQKSGPTPGSATPLDQIVKYCQGGVDMDTVTAYIKDPVFLQQAKETGYKFNFQNDPLVLAANCKSNAPAIQKMIRERLAPQRPGTRK
jgi:hypothetical protein